MKSLILGLLFCSNIVIASSPLYVPQVELDLQLGKSRNYGRASVLVPFAKDGNSLPFLNVFGLSDSLGASEGNIGLGYRRLYSDSIYGGYVFYDKRKSNLDHMYQQLTFGAEYLLQNFEARVNGYVPIGKSKNITANSHMERSLPGFDIELGGNLFSNFESYVSFYYFGDKDVSMPGYRLRSVYSINSNIKLLGELSHDKIRGFNYFAGIKLRASLGSEKGLSGLEKKMVQNVVRDIDIVAHVEKNPEFTAEKSIHIDMGIKLLNEDGLALMALLAELDNYNDSYSNPKDVQRAYKRLALKHKDCRHPDKGGAASGFVSLTRAKDALLQNSVVAMRFAEGYAARRIQSVYRGFVARDMAQSRKNSAGDGGYINIIDISALTMGGANAISGYQLRIGNDIGSSDVVINRNNRGYSIQPLRVDKVNFNIITSGRLSNAEIGNIFTVTPVACGFNVSLGLVGGMPGGGKAGGNDAAAEERKDDEDAAWHGDAFRAKLQWVVDNYLSDQVEVADFFAKWERRIASGASIDATVNLLDIKNRFGVTIAHCAVGRGHLDVLREILKTCTTAAQRQSLLTQGNNNGNTIAHVAAYNGHADVLREILKVVRVDQRQAILTQVTNNGNTVAHCAAFKGHFDVLREILNAVPAAQSQALVTQGDNNGYTIAHVAAYNGQRNVLREMFNVVPAEQRQALLTQTNNYGSTVAHCAVGRGHLDVLWDILKTYTTAAQRQALLTQANNDGNTIAHVAAYNGYADVLREIFNVVTVAQRQTILTQGDNTGKTVAHIAAYTGHWDVLREILKVVPAAQRQAILTQVSNNGITIAHYAAVRGHLVVFREILKSCETDSERYDVLTQVSNNGITIAHYAAAAGQLNVLREIFNVVPAPQRQAFLTQGNTSGITISHLAAHKGHVHVLQWMLKQCSFSDDSPSHGLSAAAEQTSVGANVSLRGVLSAVPHAGSLAGKSTIQLMAEHLPQEACLEMLSMSPSADIRELLFNAILANQARLFPNGITSDDITRITGQPCLCNLASSQDGTIVLVAELNEAIASLVTVEGQRLSADLQDEQAYSAGVISGVAVGTFLHCSEQWQGTFDRLPDWVKESQAAQEVLAEFNFKMVEVYDGPLAFMKDSAENLISHLESIPAKSIHFSDAQFKLYNVYMQIAQQGIDEDEEDIIEQHCDKAARALLNSEEAEAVFATQAKLKVEGQGGRAFCMIINRALIFKFQSLCDEVIKIAQADGVSVYRQELERVYDELTMILEQIHYTGLESMQGEVKAILEHGEMNAILVSIMNSYQSAQLNESENIIQPLLKSIESLCPGLLAKNGVSLESQEELLSEKTLGKRKRS